MVQAGFDEQPALGLGDQGHQQARFALPDDDARLTGAPCFDPGRVIVHPGQIGQGSPGGGGLRNGHAPFQPRAGQQSVLSLIGQGLPQHDAARLQQRQQHLHQRGVHTVAVFPARQARELLEMLQDLPHDSPSGLFIDFFCGDW